MIKQAIVLLIISFLLYMVIHIKDQHRILLIGILSSRSNFLQRDIIRNGLVKDIGNESVTYKFVVADKPCLVPIESRIDKYKCSKAYFGETSEEHYFHELYNDIKELTPMKSQYSIQGLDFDLLQDVEVISLGLIDVDKNGIKSNLKVIVYNRITFEPVIAVLFLPFSQGKLVGKFRFKNCSKQFLPKAFKGSLVIESLDNDTVYFTSKCKSSALFIVNKGLRFDQNAGDFPLNFLSYNNGCLVGPTMFFTINASNSSRNSSYSNHIIQEKQQLSNEIDRYGDILLVDTEEVYRNLPMKMLQFYKWVLPKKFDFILKTDDDCFINITGIMKLLNSIESFEKLNLWIGNFRENFAIDRHGKWAEHDYVAVSYPPFACGSGYLLSKDLVDWLALNSNKLKLYQGEDTSLGIWLSAIKPNRIQDERFQCARTCKNKMFSLPENDERQLESLYSQGIYSFSCDDTVT